MNKRILITLVLLIFAIVCNPQNSFAQSTPIEIDARTFILSNEAPGYLIDNLIAAGYGDSSLYAVMQYLQPLSGGAIPQWFMDSLAVCPANSDVFTAGLWNFSDPSNNPIGIAEDGTLVIAPIYGRDLSGKEGYTTYNDTLIPVSLKFFTEAIGPEFYIDAGSNTVQTPSGLVITNYKVFAIAWSADNIARTFMLSNEAPGYLIDNLIAQGYGDSCLYAVMQYLQPLSGGVIPQWFMDILAACPANSDVFTAKLFNFSDPSNNPIGIGEDGSVIISGIYGRDYSVMEGYTTYNDTLVPVSLKLFTKAIGPEFYIDAGTRTVYDSSVPVTTHYKAFAIAWSMGSTFILSNEEGGLIDDLIAGGYGSASFYEVLVAMTDMSGGVISDAFLATLRTCPSGSEIFTAPLSGYAGIGNAIGINTDGTLKILDIKGRDYYDKEGYATYPEGQAGVGRELFTYATSPGQYIDAGSSDVGGTITYYKAFAIAWSDKSVGISETETGRAAPFVYPNPFSEGFYFRNLPEQTRIEVFDLQGKLLYHTEPKANSMVQPGLLPKGIYILKLINSQGSTQQKIVKY